MSGWRGLIVLLALAVAMSQFGSPLVSKLLLPFVVIVLAAYVDREGRYLARVLVRVGARLLPAAKREEERDEWLDHIEMAGQHGVLPLTRALSIVLIAAPLLAVGLRVGRARKRTAR